jgi:hypothetical protein
MTGRTRRHPASRLFYDALFRVAVAQFSREIQQPGRPVIPGARPHGGPGFDSNGIEALLQSVKHG